MVVMTNGVPVDECEISLFIICFCSRCKAVKTAPQTINTALIANSISINSLLIDLLQIDIDWNWPKTIVGGNENEINNK